MKITYPECQIEISTEEIIDLLDHFVERTSARQHVSTKKPDMPDEEPAPTFEPGGIISTDDDMPAPKPYPNLTDHEAIVQRGEGFLNFIKQGLEDAEAQGKLPEMQIPTEEEPSPVEIPIARKRKNPPSKSRQHESTIAR